MLSLILTLAGVTQADQEEETLLGRPSTIQPSGHDSETILLIAGARLREQPRSDSPILEILDTPLELPVLDRQGSWVKVRFGNWQGWFRPSHGDPGQGEELPFSFETDDERLLGAHSLLRGNVDPRPLGPFILYTDVVDDELLDWLSAVAWDVLRAYRERFDLDPGSPSREVVVLYAEEADYRVFEAADSRIAMAHSRGYTSEGLSVLFSGSHSRESLVSILIHEITHLLNRRVFPIMTPPWLEEGMAEDLAFCRVNEEGQIRLGTLAGETTEEFENWFSLSGPIAHLAALFASWSSPTPPDLETLVNMSWADFIKPEVRELHYAQSAMLLRFFADGGNRNLKAGYRRYLEAVAEAELATSPSLWDTLGAGPEQVETGLYRFVQQQAVANGIETE